MSMTISEALRAIRKLKGQAQEWRERAASCLVHNEDEPPAFVFDECATKLEDTIRELVRLEEEVATANASTLIEVDGRTISLAGAIRSMQELKSQIAWVKTLHSLEQASVISAVPETVIVDGSYTRHMVQKKKICHLPRRSQADLVAVLQDRFDALNSRVEHANHQVKLRSRTSL